MSEEFAPGGAGGVTEIEELIEDLTDQYYSDLRQHEKLQEEIQDLLPELVELVGPVEASALQRDVQTLARNFPQSPSPLRPQRTPLTSYARFAELAYEQARASLQRRIRAVTKSFLNDARFRGTKWYFNRATRDVLQFENVETGQFVVAVRGTDRPADIFDEWLMTAVDRELVPTAIHEQTSQMVSNLLTSGVKPEDIIVTGHSLGGNIANDVSRIHGTRAITFNEFVTAPNHPRADGFKEGPRVLRVQSSRDYANLQKILRFDKLQPESVTGIRYLKFERPFKITRIKDPHSIAHFVDPNNKTIADSLNTDFFQFLEDSYKNTAFQNAKKSIEERLTRYQEHGTAKKGVLRSIKKSVGKAIKEKELMEQGDKSGKNPIERKLNFDEEIKTGTKLAKKCAQEIENY